MYTRSFPAFVFVAFLTIPPSLCAQTLNERIAAYDLSPGLEIRMDLSAGEYAIIAGPDDKLRVQWTSPDPDRLDKVRVRFTTERGRVKLETDDTKDTAIRIEVPGRSTLHVRLSAGELSVDPIDGDKDIGVGVGELRVAVGDPAAYADVRSSVRIGEINAAPFQVNKGGFFRGFKLAGQGQYLLKATVGVGEVALVP
jgi:hypothetical protein